VAGNAIGALKEEKKKKKKREEEDRIRGRAVQC